MTSAKHWHISIFKRSYLYHCHMFRHLYCYAWDCRSRISLASRYHVLLCNCFAMFRLIHIQKNLQTHFECSTLQRQMQLERGQIHSLLSKVANKLYDYLYRIAGEEIESTLPRLKEVAPCYFLSVIDPSTIIIRIYIYEPRTKFGSLNACWVCSNI